MGVPDRLALNLLLASCSALASGQVQSDSLEWTASPDSAVQEEIVVDWEKEWTEWCETAHCVTGALHNALTAKLLSLDESWSAPLSG